MRSTQLGPCLLGMSGPPFQRQPSQKLAKNVPMSATRRQPEVRETNDVTSIEPTCAYAPVIANVSPCQRRPPGAAHGLTADLQVLIPQEIPLAMTWHITSANRSTSARVVYTLGVPRMPEKSLWADRDGDDLVPCEQTIGKFGRLDPVDMNQRDPARGLVVIQRGPDPDPAAGLLERPGPSIAEIPQPRRFPLVANALMERQRRGDRVVVRRRMSPDLLVFADILIHVRRRRHERPDRLELRLPDVEKSDADRGKQPR